MPASSFQQQKLRVCEVCSAYLGLHDNDRRLADHFGGKLHLGFIEIREKLDKLRVRGWNLDYTGKSRSLNELILIICLFLSHLCPMQKAVIEKQERMRTRRREEREKEEERERQWEQDRERERERDREREWERDRERDRERRR